VLNTSAGAASGTGRTTIGTRTLWVPSLSVSCPPVYALKLAVVRVKVTVKVALPPGRISNCAGRTLTSNPAMPVKDALYVALDPLTFVTVRVTV
jgi:hypothetical protein